MKLKKIMLDWNVIKYLKEPEKIKESEKKKKVETLKKILAILKYKGYKIPFCKSHLADLRKSFSLENENLVKEDLKFLENLSDCYYIDHEHKLGKTKLLENEEYKKYFDIIKAQEEKNIKFVTSIENLNYEFKKIDIEKNPLFSDLVEENNEKIEYSKILEYLNTIPKDFITGTVEYKKIRKKIKIVKKYIESNWDNLPNDAKIEYSRYSKAFFDSLECEDEEELSKIWKEVVKNYIFSKNQNITDMELIIVAYVMLDFHPLFKNEKIYRKNKFTNIVYDANIVYFASGCDIFITEDEKCYKKSKFIFKAFNIKTKVYKISEFVNKFNLRADY